MRLSSLATAINAKILACPEKTMLDITGVYAGDRISDLLLHASDATMLVTNLSNASLARLIGLMDIPALCVIGAVEPDEVLVQAAEQTGCVLMLSPNPLFETCGHLFRAMNQAGGESGR